MARTKGSGWGAGPILYQICPNCGKKKCYFDWHEYLMNLQFYCTYCKERNSGEGLIRSKYNPNYK